MGSRVAVASLEPEVVNALRDCESRIDKALDDAWHALREIHESKLYKADGYKTFEDYVEKRWGYSKTRAYQLIDHSKFMSHLKAEGVEVLPSGEGLTRPLMKLRRISKNEDDFMQRAELAWKVATDNAPKKFDVPQMTVEHVEETMKQYGFYRTPKKTGTSQAAEDLRALLVKIGQSDALKMSSEAFMTRFEGKGFPNNFQKIIGWLMECAELGAGAGE